MHTKTAKKTKDFLVSADLQLCFVSIVVFVCFGMKFPGAAERVVEGAATGIYARPSSTGRSTRLSRKMATEVTAVMDAIMAK